MLLSFLACPPLGLNPSCCTVPDLSHCASSIIIHFLYLPPSPHTVIHILSAPFPTRSCLELEVGWIIIPMSSPVIGLYIRTFCHVTLYSQCE